MDIDLAQYATIDNLKILGGAVAALILVGVIGSFFLKKIRDENDNFLKVFYRNLFNPVKYLVIVTVLFTAVKQIEAEWVENPAIGQGYTIVLIFLMAWLVFNLINAFGDLILKRFNIDIKDNLNARMVHTQIRVVSRLLKAIVAIIAVAAALMTFDEIRSLGVSLLASAGMASIVIGLAAQKTIGNFFTGLQIAITQPIRLGDAVVVEGEWGWIEEINLTYVVVKIWDWRRLVLPISYFVDNPFQNWTRRTASIIGTVSLYLDYSMPVEPLREELDKILEQTDLWSEDVKVVQVIDASEKTMHIRILVSAVDSPTAWDLRCFVREKMITFIQENYPEHLPKLRTELEGEIYGQKVEDLSDGHSQQG
ncbi:MAG: mechanosensitive ion channel protein MscS [Micavibrio sp.]|nr:mechanosensitive ion channel protein MscS [Micavibrio sp.]